MMASYLKFCSQYNRTPLNPSINTIVSYLEFLAQKLKSPKSISNYWAAVKFLHARLNVTLSNAQAIDVTLMLRSISLTKRHVSCQKSPITKTHLITISSVLDKQGTQGVVIKCAVLFGFFAFLRGSNLCPQNETEFDHTRHFTRQDVKCQQQGLVLALKWAKNMQTSLQPQYIHIPTITPKHIDPVHTFKLMCSLVPALPHQPLFLLPNNKPLTIQGLRSCFKLVCQQVGLDVDLFSVHSLRRGGATHAHHAGAQPRDIQRHGCWSSQSYWDYIAPLDPPNSSVAMALRN